MSDDLISRQAAIEKLRDAENHAFNSYYKGLLKAHHIIADLPSIQTEQKEGRWVYMKDCENWFCSNCKDIFMLLEGTPKDNDYNYCPNCGAFMKG